MNYRTWLVIGFILVIAACSGDQDKKFEQKDKNFYPIASFIESELFLVDSLPLAVFKYTIDETGTDTQLVAKPDFRKIAETFMSPDITIEPLKEKYTETVFMDETINTVTFSYSTEDTTAEIRKIDVFINPENDRVKNIYVEKINRGSDSIIIRKMIWTAGKHFQVSTVVSKSGMPDKNLQEKYTWDFNQ